MADRDIDFATEAEIKVEGKLHQGWDGADYRSGRLVRTHVNFFL